MSGWSIADKNLTRPHGGGTWTEHANGSMKMRFSGYPRNLLVSNTGQAASNTNFGLGEDHAQLFTTGQHAQGYKLTKLQLDWTVGNPSGNQPVFTITLAASDNLSPGATLATLTKPSGGITAGINTYTLPGGGYNLVRGTSYFIVFQMQAGGTINAAIKSTAADAEDSGGAALWTIRNNGHRKGRAATDTWQVHASESMKIRLFASERTITNTPSGSPSQRPAGAPPPDPANLARGAVAWHRDGGRMMQGFAARMSEIRSNQPHRASGSLDLTGVLASIPEERRDASRGFFVTSQVFEPAAQPTLVQRAPGGGYVLTDAEGASYVVHRSSPLLRIRLWHVYRRASTGINTIELLGDAFHPRPTHTLAEPIEVCVSAPSRDADRTRIAVRGRLDQHWTVLDTALKDGQLCAETTRVAWLALVLAPEDEAV